MNPTHMFAPVAKYAIGAGQFVFGTTPLGARVGTVAVGLCLLASVYLLTRKLADPPAGIVATVAVGSVPLIATHATSAMLDILLTLPLTVLCGVVFLDHTEFDGRRSHALALGAAVILSSASKAYRFVYMVGPLAVLELLAVSPAATFAVTGLSLSADSQYDDVTRFLSETAVGEQVAVADPVILWWHLSDSDTERYNFDPTRHRTFKFAGVGELTVVGFNGPRPDSVTEAGESILNGSVRYVAFNGPAASVGSANVPVCGTRLRTWRAHTTSEVGTHPVSVWRVDGCADSIA